MALDINSALVGLSGVTGGVVETANTGPVTIETGVTVSGAALTVLGDLTGVLSGVLTPILGDGVVSNDAAASVTNAGTVIGTGVVLPALGLGTGAVGVVLEQGGTLLNRSGATIRGVADGVLSTGTAALDNLGSIQASAGAGVATTAGTLRNEVGGAIAGTAQGVLGTGTAAITNAGTISGSVGVGVSITGGSLTNAATGVVRGVVDGILNTGAGVLDNFGSVLATAGDGVSTTAGTLTNEAGATVTGSANGIKASGTAVLTNAGSVVGQAASGATIAGGTLTNAATGTIQGATSGVAVTAGNVTNAAGGAIKGVVDGILNTGAGTLDNLGSVLATAGDGVSTTAGTLTNEAGATVTGSVNGIVGGGTAALTNAGSVIGQAASGAMLAGGTLTNAATGTIQGALDGVLMTAGSGPGSVMNLGSITATGPNGIGVDLLDGGVVIDSGSIGGSDASGHPGGIAVDLGAGNSRLVLDPGAALQGIAQATGTGNTLELAAGTGAGAATTVLNDIGTTITGFGQTVLDSGVVAKVLGAITTPGTVSLGNGSSLTVGGPVAQGVTIDLGGTDATLNLGDAAGFAGTLANLGAGDTLDLDGLTAGTTVTYSSGPGFTGLTLTPPGGAASQIALTLPVGVSLGLTPDGLGVTVGSGGTGTSITVGGGTGTGGGGTGTGGGGTGTGGGGTGTGGGGTGTGGGGTGTGGTGTGGTGTGTGGTGTGGTGTGGGTDTGGGPLPGGGTTDSGGTAGSGGSSTVTTDPNGGIIVTTTSALGATTTQSLPAGSSVATGTGTAGGDVISIDPSATFDGRGKFTITGHASSPSGVGSVAISAVVDGGATVQLGTASVAADGSFTFEDRVGPHLQGFITATEADGAGATTGVQSPYSLQAGFRGVGYVAQQVLFTPDGSAFIGITDSHRDGSNTVEVNAAGQTFRSDVRDTFHNGGAPENTFVFKPGYGADVIDLFRVNGAGHDTISLPSSDFADMADVLRNAHNTAGGVTITDQASGDTIRLAGVSKAELKANPADFKFHA